MIKKDVLIIDDEPWYFEPFLDQLDHVKTTYDYCENCNKGLKLLHTNNYKLVVLDMKVGLGGDFQETDGYDPPGLFLLEKIKNQTPGLPVLCFTVLTDSDIVSKIEKFGGRHIAKGKEGETTLINDIKTLIDSTDYVILGNQEYIKGNYEQAEFYFKLEIQKNKDYVNAWVGLARTYSELGKLVNAMDMINEAIKLDQMNPIFNNKGQLSIVKAEILMDFGKMKEARDILTEILNTTPEFIKAKIFLAQCEDELKWKKHPKPE